MIRSDTEHRLIIKATDIDRTSHFVGSLDSLALGAQGFIAQVSTYMGEAWNPANISYTMTEFFGDKLSAKQERAVPPLTGEEIELVKQLDPSESNLPWFLAAAGLVTLEQVGLSG